MVHDNYLEDCSAFLHLLIWRGADPAKIELGSRKDAYRDARKANGRLYNFMKQERQKYEAVGEILKEQENEYSYLNWLPLEILDKIIPYIKHGKFEPPVEKKIMPPKVEPIVNVPVPAEMPKEKEEQEKNVGEDSESPTKDQCAGDLGTHIEEPETTMPIRSTSSIFRRIPIPIIGVGVAAMGVGYWAYKRWCKRKEETRKATTSIAG